MCYFGELEKPINFISLRVDINIQVTRCGWETRDGLDVGGKRVPIADVSKTDSNG